METSEGFAVEGMLQIVMDIRGDVKLLGFAEEGKHVCGVIPCLKTYEFSEISKLYFKTFTCTKVAVIIIKMLLESNRSLITVTMLSGTT